MLVIKYCVSESYETLSWVYFLQYRVQFTWMNFCPIKSENQCKIKKDFDVTRISLDFLYRKIDFRKLVLLKISSYLFFFFWRHFYNESIFSKVSVSSNITVLSCETRARINFEVPRLNVLKNTLFTKTEEKQGNTRERVSVKSKTFVIEAGVILNLADITPTVHSTRYIDYFQKQSQFKFFYWLSIF